jgi:hypothetical protein
MNEITITLEGKEYQIDIQKAKELDILKEKDTRCKSWEEFTKKYLNGYGYSKGSRCSYPIYIDIQLTQDESLALSAFSKLLKLRRDWIGIWEPNWCNSMEIKYYIAVHRNEFYVDYCSEYSKTFSFPTKEIAKEFLECFRSLFEQCKMLI